MKVWRGGIIDQQRTCTCNLECLQMTIFIHNVSITENYHTVPYKCHQMYCTSTIWFPRLAPMMPGV